MLEGPHNIWVHFYVLGTYISSTHQSIVIICKFYFENIIKKLKIMYFRSSDMEKLTHKLETRYMSFRDDFGAIRKAIVDYGTIDPKVRLCDVDMDNICEGFEDLNWLEQTNGEIPHDFADIVSTLQYNCSYI